MAEVRRANLPPGQRRWTLLMISHHWLKSWLGTVGQIWSRSISLYGVTRPQWVNKTSGLMTTSRAILAMHICWHLAHHARLTNDLVAQYPSITKAVLQHMISREHATPVQCLQREMATVTTDVVTRFASLHVQGIGVVILTGTRWFNIIWSHADANRISCYYGKINWTRIFLSHRINIVSLAFTTHIYNHSIPPLTFTRVVHKWICWNKNLILLCIAIKVGRRINIHLWFTIYIYI